MREANRSKIYIFSKEANHSDNIVDSFDYENKDINSYQELIKIRPVSILVRRLQWNEVIKKRFSSKYRLMRPCVSQISRQLLNFEIKKKKNKNHVLESKKVLISEEPVIDTDSFSSRLEEYPSSSYLKIIDNSFDLDKAEIKMKSREMPPNSAEPPLKKLKRNEHEENFFIGFDSGSSPTRSLVKLKTVHLKKFKGLDPPKIKSGIGDIRSLSSKSISFRSSESSLAPMCISNDSKSSPNTVCDSTLLKLSDSASREEVEGANHVISKSENKFNDIIDSEGIPVKYIHSPSNGDLGQIFPNAKTIINCVARKHTSKPNTGFKTLTKHQPVSRIFVGNSALNNCNESSVGNGVNNNYDLECSIQQVSGGVSESILPIIPKESASDEDSDGETISICDSVKYLSSDEESSKVEPFMYLKDALDIPVNQGSLCADKKFKSKSSKLMKDQFTDSDSDSTSDSLCSISSSNLCESSEDDTEKEDRPFIDLSKFLACDFNLTNTDESANYIIHKSQNIQLKSDCQVKVYMLKASDITDIFCRNNSLSWINGFKLKQSLCTLIHSPQNGYGNFIIEVDGEKEDEEEETIETPHFLTVRDPLIHIVFSVLIRRDMRTSFVPQLRLLDLVNRALVILNPVTNRSYITIRSMSGTNQNVSASYSNPRPLLATSNGNYIPITNSSSVSPVNSNYNRMTLIAPNNIRPNYPHNINYGSSGNFILFPNSVGTASGGTLIFQQPNNASRMGVTSSRYIIGQSSQLAPPPLTLGSDFVRPGIQGQQFSISQPPPLTKMNPTVAPVIDLTSSQNLQPHNFHGWPVGHFQNPHVFAARFVEASICCRNHKLELFQLQSMMKAVVESVKALVKIGLPKNKSTIMNAAFQMLYSNNLICCKVHSIAAVNRDENFRSLLQNITGFSVNYQFVELPLPSPLPSLDMHPWMIPNHDILIIKRFVFAVDKITRTVIYPLPPNCIPRDNDLIDKLTVVIMISPLKGLGPGLIVFPHSLLNRSLLSSLDSTSSITSIGKDWVLSAHQRGGLTQSMLLEYLDECRLWVNQPSQIGQPILIVDWWWCLEQKLLNSTFSTLRVVNLQEKYAQYQDPLEISLGTTMERIWGILVRKFTQTVGPLTEASFPKFIIQVLKDLCTPPRLNAWCRTSGLYPLDTFKAEEFRKSLTITENF